MNTSPMLFCREDCYELVFKPLLADGRGYAFRCDACGNVNIDALSDGAREAYLYARTVIGRNLSVPTVEVRARADSRSSGVARPPS